MFPKRLGLGLVAAVISGLALRGAVGIAPIWWLAWIAPVPLLVLALRNEPTRARVLVSIAALIAVSVSYRYYRTVTIPIPTALLLIGLQALLWQSIIAMSCRIMLRYRAAWTVLAYPVLWTAADTLMAAFLPDGNFTSLAYSQGQVLPVLQVASLVGVAGVVFVLGIVASTLAYVIVIARTTPRPWIAPAATAVVVAASLCYGVARLVPDAGGIPTTFGIASIDDAIGLEATHAYSQPIADAYDRHIHSLAARGATIVVLPESIALLDPRAAATWQQHSAELARRDQIWLEFGITVARPDGTRENRAWLFRPDGSLASDYQKHHIAPPERAHGVVAGDALAIEPIAGRGYGLAICKDMHFATLARAYADRSVAVMLVPAWDFGIDAELAERVTAIRAIEGGFTIVRASREGLLTISDARGQILAETSSTALPGANLVATVRVPPPRATLYAAIGDSFGWLCVVGALGTLALAWRSRRVDNESNRVETVGSRTIS